MRVLSSLAAMASMASVADGFTTSAFVPHSKTSSSSSLGMINSYQDQLNKFNKDRENTVDVDNMKSADSTINANAQPPANNGWVQSPPPPPMQFSQGNQQQADVSKPNLVFLGVGFLGLPLWLLLSFQVFFSKPAPVEPVPTVPTQSIILPESLAKSEASNSGVIVLSQPITKFEVRRLFNLWNDALKTGDPDIVTQRYGKDGVLLPTLSDIPRTNYAGIKDYFVHFLEKKPVGKILEGEIYIGNNWAQDAGIYEFTFEDGSTVKARYSFVYAFEDGQWVISHHHSSLMPQEVVRPTKITETEVRGFFDLWNDALHTGQPYTVAARYSKDAVLLPTLSDKARYTTDEIADYFVHFLAKKPDGKILEGNIKIGPNWAQDAGIYEFTFEDGSKTRGRYSYVYTFENGEWKISNHHSSIMPEPAVAAFKKNTELEKKIATMEPKTPAAIESAEVKKAPIVVKDVPVAAAVAAPVVAKEVPVAAKVEAPVVVKETPVAAKVEAPVVVKEVPVIVKEDAPVAVVVKESIDMKEGPVV